MKYRFMGKSPKIGYRNAPEVRGKHPSGRREVLVSNMAELESVQPINGNLAIRVASALARRRGSSSRRSR
jgi:ribosomal protein L32E